MSMGERHVFVAASGSIDDFAAEVDQRLRPLFEGGYNRTLHVSHSMAFVGDTWHWSAIIVLGE